MEVDWKKPNWTKDGKSKCFNYREYRHLARNCQKPKKAPYKKNRVIEIDKEEEQDFQEREE